ncbi:NADH-quinone oxidoreductase subunit K [bacterium]|nr:MAG: NADH-quinone oxidoreductase subunit K [bacterium]
MNSDILILLWPFFIFVIMLFIIGFYCLLVTFNLIRALIGIELLMKAATLLIIVVGYATGYTAFAQALVITLIVVEVAIITVAMGIILGLYRNNKTLDTRKLRNLKG